MNRVRILSALMLFVPVFLIVWLASKKPTEDPASVPSTDERSEPLADLSLTEDKRAVEDFEMETLVPRLEQIAEHFEQSIRYPDFSMPILDPAAIVKYQPNQAAEMYYERHGRSLRLQTRSLHYRSDEPISGQVQVMPAGPATVQLDIMQQGQVIASQTLKVAHEHADFSFPPLGQSWHDPQLLLVASMRVHSDLWRTSAPLLKDDPSMATIELVAVGDSYVDGPWLVIPAQVRSQQDGYFRLEGNLYAADDRPLVHLSTQAALAAGDRQLLLRAHIQALKAQPAAGDYWLRDISLQQMPAPPDYQEHPGVLSIKSAPVHSFPLSAYQYQRWQDPEAQARLQFLKQLTR